MSKEGREDWSNSSEKQIVVDPNPGSRSGPHLKQQGGFEKLQKARR